MDNEFTKAIKQAQQLHGLMADESNKIAAAKLIVDAKEKELEAAMMLKDVGQIDKAREALMFAHEAHVDARIAGVRRASELSDQLRAS